MAKTFKAKILLPEKTIFEGEITSLVAPCVYGYLGILANHAPLVARLRPGRILLKKELRGNFYVFRNLGSGFLQVKDNLAILLLESAQSDSYSAD